MALVMAEIAFDATSSACRGRRRAGYGAAYFVNSEAERLGVDSVRRYRRQLRWGHGYETKARASFSERCTLK